MASTTASLVSRRILLALCLGAICVLTGWLAGRGQVQAPAPEVRRAAELPPRPAAVQTAALPEQPGRAERRTLLTGKPPAPAPTPLSRGPERPPPPAPAVAPPPPPVAARAPALPAQPYPQAPASDDVVPDGLVREVMLNPFPVMPAARFVDRAEKASARLDSLLQSRQLQALFTGTGGSGEMVEVYFENTSGRTLTFALAAGMILRPPSRHKVQPLLLDDERTVQLGPGESYVARLNSYCMDSQVPAPAAGEDVQYRFSPRSRHNRGPEAVRVLQAYRKLEPSFATELPAELHKSAVIQVAIWKSLGQRTEDGHLRSALHGWPLDAAQRRAFLRDVQLVVDEARR